jgi:hypothetical protein
MKKLTELEAFIEMLYKKNSKPNSIQILYTIDTGDKFTDVVFNDREHLTTTFTFYSDTGELYDVELTSSHYCD